MEENYNEKQFSGEEKEMRNGSLRDGAKSLLLHYDKHENNFPLK
jgi:hypothetical protein